MSPGWAGWGPPVGLRWVGSAGTGSMPHRAPGGILATGYLQPAGMRSSRCPSALLLGTVFGAAAASSETTPAPVISATSVTAAALIAAAAAAERTVPGQPPQHAQSPPPFPRPRCTASVPVGRSAPRPHSAGTHSPCPPPAPKPHPRERGSPGPPRSPPGRRDRVLRPATAEARALLRRCRGWREPGKFDCCRYLSQRGLEELGNCKCLIKGC